jgi:hypothetical protein
MAMSEETRIQNNLKKLTPLSVDQLAQLQTIELDAIARFVGTTDELETSLGFLRLGFQIGWKPLMIIHSKKTVRKYEQILGINSRELFPEETASSERIMGFKIAKKLSNFWKAVSGETKIEGRREIS